MLARIYRNGLCVVLLLAMPVLAAAQPSLEVQAFRASQRYALMPFVWEQSWWVEVNAASGSAALDRLEFWVQGVDRSRRQAAGNFSASPGALTMAGKVAIRFPINADHNERLRVRMRVHDTAGEASDWQALVFPDDAETMTTDDSVPQAPVPPAANTRVTTVEFVADDTMPMGEVRAALASAAAALGGSVVGAPRIVAAEAGRTRFVADVRIEPTARAAAPPPPVPTPDRTALLGEIVVPDEPLR